MKEERIITISDREYEQVTIKEALDYCNNLGIEYEYEPNDYEDVDYYIIRCNGIAQENEIRALITK